MNIGEYRFTYTIEPIERPVTRPDAADAPAPAGLPGGVRLRETADTPDCVEPIIGFRGWLSVDERTAPRLASPHYPAVWPPGRTQVASCRDATRAGRLPWLHEEPAHDAPAPEHACGIYASARPSVAARFLDRIKYDYPEGSRAYPVAGLVRLWGTVLEHEDGWRGSRAYPLRLWVPALPRDSERAHAIAAGLLAYGVPVEPIEVTTQPELETILAAGHPQSRPLASPRPPAATGGSTPAPYPPADRHATAA